MRLRHGLFFFGLAAAVAAGVVLRLHTREQAIEGDRVRPLDSDSAYHLRRARFAVPEFPRTILFDPLMNFPAGGIGIWPPLWDLALAAPARLAHGTGATAGQIERGAAWLPVAAAAGTIALAGLLGAELSGAAAGLALAFFVSLCPGHILWTQYAHVDQHAAESLCGTLFLLLFVRSRGRDGPEGQPRRDAAAGLALAVAVLAWQGAIYWGAIAALALVCEAWLTRRSILRAAAWTLALPALVTAAATAAWLSWLRPPLTYVSFGYFQPLFLAALFGGAAAAGLAIGAARGTLSRRERAEGLVAVLLAATVTLPFAGSLFGGLVRGVGYVAGSTSELTGATGYVSYPEHWLKGIFEARPLLEDGPGLALGQLSAAFFLAPLVVLAWGARAWRGVRPGVHAALAIWGAVTIFLVLSQRLNVYYAVPLAGLALLEAVRAGGVLLSRRAKPGQRTAALALAAAGGLALVLPMAGALSEELSTEHVPGSDLFHTLARMRSSLPHAIAAYDPRLLGPPPFPAELSRASAVMAPWSLGHLVLYEAELPVVANNFGYGFLDSIRFFLAESEDEALAIARRHRVRWIIATDLAARMNDYASYLGRPPYLRDTNAGAVPTPAYFATMQSRLYDFAGRGAALPGGQAVAPLSRIRLLFHSQSAIQRGGRWIPRWSIFEITAE